MRTIGTLVAVAAAAGIFFVVGEAPATAATANTLAFLANVHPSVDYLDRSSRMALDHSGNRAIKSFAHGEAIEQTMVANSIVAWTQANTINGAILATAPGEAIVPVVGLAKLDVPDVVTGRSVALDVPIASVTLARLATPRELLPAGQTDIDRLESRSGRGFDALYRTSQTDVLRQLATLYASYMENGDDPQLREMSAQELPKVRRRLAQLSHL